MATVGPPPGLAQPQVSGSAKQARVYSRSSLLALSQSPHVQTPSNLPPLQAWYGEWESYAPKQQLQQRDPQRRVEEVDSSSDGLSFLPNYQSASRRSDGSRFRRHEDREAPDGLVRINDPAQRKIPPSGKNPFGQVSSSGTFRPAGGLRDGLDSPVEERKRFPLPERMPSYGRDRARDAAPHLSSPHDERPSRIPRGTSLRTGDGKELGGFRDKRRIVDETESEGRDWEDNERSPEMEKRTRPGGADLASDWRRGSGQDRLDRGGGRNGGVNGLRGDRLRDADRVRNDRIDRLGDREYDRDERRRGGVPAWMAEDEVPNRGSTPSWMSDDANAATSLTTSEMTSFGRPGTGQRHDGTGVPMDSIQAFKAQMREKEKLERLERERRAGAEASSTAAGPPGLEVKTSPPSSAQELGTQSRQDPSTDANSSSIFDSFSNNTSKANLPSSTGTVLRLGTGGDEQHADASRITRGSAAVKESAGPPSELPGRSSRFAKFFDGKPREAQSNALAAHQRQMEDSSKSPAPSISSPVAASAYPVDESASTAGTLTLADLFKGASVATGGGSDGAHAAGTLGPARDSETNALSHRSKPRVDSEYQNASQNPSAADFASMQKIMAMLQGGVSARSPVVEGSHLPRPDSRGLPPHLPSQVPPQSHQYTTQQFAGTPVQDPPRNLGTPDSELTQQLNNARARGSPVPPSVNSPAMNSASASWAGQPPQHHPFANHQRIHSNQSMSSQTAQPSSNQQHSQGQYGNPSYAGYGFGSAPSGHRPGESSMPPMSGHQQSPAISPAMGFQGGRPPSNMDPRIDPRMDPRMYGRPGPEPSPGPAQPGSVQLPPHLAAMNGMANARMPPNAGSAGRPPFSNFPGPSPHGQSPPAFVSFPGRPMHPPHIQQQLMNLPPHLQQQFLAQQGLGGFPPMGPQQGGLGGFSGPSPTPPPVPVGTQAMGGANLMALLRGPGAF